MAPYKLAPLPSNDKEALAWLLDGCPDEEMADIVMAAYQDVRAQNPDADMLEVLGLTLLHPRVLEAVAKGDPDGYI